MQRLSTASELILSAIADSLQAGLRTRKTGSLFVASLLSVSPGLPCSISAHQWRLKNPLIGAPELIIEVSANPEKDQKRDRETKLKLYSIQGISEYWIVDRDQELIEVFRPEKGILKKALTLFKARLTSPLSLEFKCEVGSLLDTDFIKLLDDIQDTPLPETFFSDEALQKLLSDLPLTTL